MLGGWIIIGAVEVSWVGAVDAVGVGDVICIGVGRGVNAFVGGDSAVAGSGFLAGGSTVADAGEGSVVKAPAALQALRVLALMALTFQ